MQLSRGGQLSWTGLKQSEGEDSKKAKEILDPVLKTQEIAAFLKL